MLKVISENAVADRVVVLATCPFCNKQQQFGVSLKQFEDWNAGMLIQNAFPDLSPDKRELLMTGICNDCWPKEEL